MPDPILFYGLKGTYGGFSNWYQTNFELDGKRWRTSEHYYMAQKTHDKDAKEKIRKAPSPRDAKALAGPRGIIQLRKDWDSVKFDVMVKACYAKFTQDAHLRDLLLSTGDLSIHEDCSDEWWGGGPNFPDGRDLLGKALMKVRGMIRDVSKTLAP